MTLAQERRPRGGNNFSEKRGAAMPAYKKGWKKLLWRADFSSPLSHACSFSYHTHMQCLALMNSPKSFSWGSYKNESRGCPKKIRISKTRLESLDTEKLGQGNKEVREMDGRADGSLC